MEILTRASLSEEENQTTALSHLYDFIDYYAVKNGKEFILSQEYSSETLEFAHNVISLLENKIWKIENDMDKKQKNK